MKPADEYIIEIPIRLTAVLRAMRRAKGLSQAAAGNLVGVSRKRVAQIEERPGDIQIDLFARYVSALGGRVVISSSADTGG